MPCVESFRSREFPCSLSAFYQPFKNVSCSCRSDNKVIQALIYNTSVGNFSLTTTFKIAVGPTAHLVQKRREHKYK
jgi:hypothetical protein